MFTLSVEKMPRNASDNSATPRRRMVRPAPPGSTPRLWDAASLRADYDRRLAARRMLIEDYVSERSDRYSPSVGSCESCGRDEEDCPLLTTAFDHVSASRVESRDDGALPCGCDMSRECPILRDALQHGNSRLVDSNYVASLCQDVGASVDNARVKKHVNRVFWQVRAVLFKIKRRRRFDRAEALRILSRASSDLKIIRGIFGMYIDN